MNRTYRILAWVLGILLTSILFVILMPSLMGIVLIVLMIFGITRFTISKQRHAADAFNSVLKSVVERGGDVTSVAVAFSKSGPLSGPAYEFARRLMMGQDPMEAASKSRIPLQLSTAVAMQTRAEDGSSLPASGITATGAPPLSDQAHSRVNLTSLNQVGSSVRTIQGRLLYLFIVAMMMLFIVSFLDLFIIPTIEALEEDIRYPESLRISRVLLLRASCKVDLPWNGWFSDHLFPIVTWTGLRMAIPRLVSLLSESRSAEI